MGIEPTPTEYGDDCLRCYAAGKTPNRLHCFFGGISMGQLWHADLPVPPNDYFILTQHDVVPCRWNYASPDYEISLEYFAGFSILWAGTPAPATIFESTVLTVCEKYFPSDLVEPPNRFYAGGFGFISTPADLAAMSAKIFPDPPPDNKFEVHPKSDREIVLRIASLIRQKNIQILIDIDSI